MSVIKLSLFNRLKQTRSKQEVSALIRTHLRQQGYPRLLVSLILLMCFGVAFLVSYGLFKSGVSSMWVRYLLAMCLAYATFLGLIRLWVYSFLRDEPSKRSNVNDASVGDVPIDFGTYGSSASKPEHGGGGDAAGAGAGGSWDSELDGVGLASELPMVDGISLDFDVDAIDSVEGILIAPIIWLLMAVVMLSVGAVVYGASTLVMELVLELALAIFAAGFLNRVTRRHWLETAIKKTIIPFCLMTICVVCFAAWIGHVRPDVQTIGQFLFS